MYHPFLSGRKGPVTTGDDRRRRVPGERRERISMHESVHTPPLKSGPWDRAVNSTGDPAKAGRLVINVYDYRPSLSAPAATMGLRGAGR
jgi:hypothetical protein